MTLVLCRVPASSPFGSDPCRVPALLYLTHEQWGWRALSERGGPCTWSVSHFRVLWPTGFIDYTQKGSSFNRVTQPLSRGAVWRGRLCPTYPAPQGSRLPEEPTYDNYYSLWHGRQGPERLCFDTGDKEVTGVASSCS